MKSHLFRIKKLSARIFLLIAVLVVLPMSLISIYIAHHMEKTMAKELSERVFSNIGRNEQSIYNALTDLAYYSNVFVNDKTFTSLLSNESATEYEIASYFDDIVARSEIESASSLREDAKVIVMDKFGRYASNWSLNFNDYAFIQNESWVKESLNNDGHIIWSLFSPAYILGESGNYISLARSILSETTSGDYIGTLIISIEQSKFESIVREYSGRDDQVYVLIDNKTVLMSSYQDIRLGDEELSYLYDKERTKAQGTDTIDIEGNRYLLSFFTLPSPWLFNGSTIKFFNLSPYEPIETEIRGTMLVLWIAIAIIIALSILLSLYISNRVVKPIRAVTKQLRDYKMDMRFEGLDVLRNDEIGDLNRGVIKMNARIQNLLKKAEEEREARERYYYKALQAQLNPHYIFNTLGTIRWMAIARDADNIVEAIDSFATTLKYSMGNDNTVKVKDEVEHIESYIFIHNLRYDEYVNLKLDIPDKIMNMNVMKFILQPIVENSIIHGFDKSKSMMNIEISAYTDDKYLYIKVLDDGIGIKSDAVMAFEKKGEKRRGLTGIGLKNVDEGIKGRFGKEYGIKIRKREDERGTEALFILPKDIV